MVKAHGNHRKSRKGVLGEATVSSRLTYLVLFFLFLAVIGVAARGVVE
jgi:hypothetical protein